MELRFRNRVQYYGANLSASEKKIADFILSDPATVTSLSSSELAKRSGTSGASVTRFCQKLNYKSFIEFQTLLAREASKTSVPDSSVKKIRHYYEQILDSTIELLSPDTVKKFVNTIQKARRILICGIGSSGMTANEFSSHLLRMGISAHPVNDSHLMLTQAALLSSEDLLIAVSNSGRTEEVLKACETAFANGVPIYSLTQNNHTALTALSDELLFASNIQQTNDLDFINSQLSLLFLVDILNYELLKVEINRENYNKTLHVLTTK